MTITELIDQKTEHLKEVAEIRIGREDFFELCDELAETTYHTLTFGDLYKGHKLTVVNADRHFEIIPNKGNSR